jgi:hypothetical protein
MVNLPTMCKALAWDKSAIVFTQALHHLCFFRDYKFLEVMTFGTIHVMFLILNYENHLVILVFHF